MLHAASQDELHFACLYLGCLLCDWEHERQSMHHEHNTAARRRGVRGTTRTVATAAGTPNAVALPEM